MDFADYGSLIARALDSYDRPAVERHCEAFRDHLKTTNAVCPLPVAKVLLNNLRRKRYFDTIQQLADALLQNGQTDPYVSRQYAQALIDHGQLALAVQHLTVLLPNTAGNPKEDVEVRGLLGRAHKQMFVDSAGSTTRGAEHLGKAIEWYMQVYAGDSTQLWHGINAAALFDRAARDRIAVAGTDNPKQRAESIAAPVLQTVESRWKNGEASMWDLGTAAEACIALGHTENAVHWMERYVREPAGDAFEFASSRRQLLEIWQLTPDGGPGALMLPILEAELLKKNGGSLQLDAKRVSAPASPATQESLEAILGRDRYVSYKFMLQALERAKSVAQIRDGTDVGIGTGFIVRGGDIAKQLGDERLLLTNAHVISEDPYVVNLPALEPEEASVVFGSGREFRLKEVLWSSPPNVLDATLMRLDGDASDIEPLPIAKRLPLADGEQRVYIIGHPRGGPLSFSIHDNTLIDHEGPPNGSPRRRDVVRLHYRAPTEGGSSGSPVFNAQWRVVGIHHAGGTDMPRLNGNTGTHPANEGLWLQSIRAAYVEANDD